MEAKVLIATGLAVTVGGFLLLKATSPGLPASLTAAGQPPPQGDGIHTPVAGMVPWWTPSVHATLGDPATSGRKAWTGDFDAYPVAAYDFDDDGVKETIAQSNDTNIYVFRADGKILASFKTTYPPGWHIERVLNGVEAATLTPGEPPSIVVTNHAAYVSVWRFVPTDSNRDHFIFAKQWEKRMDLCHPSPGMDAKATVADVDGDGQMEIFVQTEEVGDYGLRADGSLLWKQCWGGGNSAPAVADLDGNGKLEVIFASDEGFIAVFEGLTGRPLWTYDATKTGLQPASIPVTPSVGDLDGDGKLEVIFAARDAHAGTPATYGENHMVIFAVHRGGSGQGELLWSHQASWAHPLSYTEMIVHDVDGDGRPEILGMDWNTIGHIPGNWENLGPAHVFALNSDGSERWMRALDSWWSNKNLVLGDFHGDGKLQLLANGARDGYDGLWRLDASTGKLEAFLPVWPYKLERGAVVADVLNNGNTQLLLPVEPLEQQGPGVGGILLLDLGVHVNAPWPGSPPVVRAPPRAPA